MVDLPRLAKTGSADAIPAVAPPDAPLQSSPPAILRYGLAVVSVTGALVLALLLRRFELRESFFLMAIAVTVWYGRMRAGLLAIVLSMLGLDYFFIPPIYHLEADLTHVPYFLVFMSFALVISWFSASRRRAEEGLRQARSELEVRVTERTAELRRTTGEALAARQRFGDLVNSVEGIVWEADASSFQFLFVSKQAERILGYPVEQWLSEAKFWEEHLHAEDRQWATQSWVQVTAEKRDHDFEYRMMAADGRTVWLRHLATAVLEHGRASRLRGVMFDITSRKQAEAALREQASLLNLTHDSIFVRTFDDVIRFWNRGAEELYGWKAKDALGKTTHELLHTRFSVPMEQIQAELLRTGRWEGELMHTTAEGTQLVVASRWALQLDAENRPVAILETNNDITSQKRAEESSRQAQADLAHVSRVTTMGELTASLAHEINQPIAAAVTNAHTCLRWLNRERPNVSEARQAATRIVKDVSRASEIITRIRSLFKKAPPERELVDVNELIREMVLLLHDEAVRSSILIRTQLAANVPRIVGDRVQLQQVFMNLMLNAIDAVKATDQSGEVSVSLREGDDGQLLISVSDTGVGLPNERAEQIFNAFYTTKPQGTGLGLTISRSIVESHGGRLWATTNAGRGTTFHLTLPEKAGG